MNANEIASLAPTGPYVEGLIRFSYDSASQGATQKPNFEVLSRVHAEEPQPGDVPKMVPHLLGDKLEGVDGEGAGRRLLSEIPIRLMFDKPENNLSARYKAFERSTGQLVCCGNGVRSVRRASLGEQPKDGVCPGPENCVFATTPEVACHLHVRMNVQLDDSQDALSVFEFQSSGINSYRTLSAKLSMLKALFGGLRGLPLRLTSWAKSSMASGYQPFYCANIELREGLDLPKAKVELEAYNKQFEGIDFTAMETAVETMQSSSAFALDESESVVTRWVPAAEIIATRAASNGGLSNSPTTGSLMGATVDAIVSRAREQSNKTPVAPAAAETIVKNNESIQKTDHEQESVQTAVDATILPGDQPRPVALEAVLALGEDENICL